MKVDLSNITGAEFLAMPMKEQMSVLTEVYRELSFGETKRWSLKSIDVLEAMGVNDEETGVANVEMMIGMLVASAKLLQQAFTRQNRLELQVMDANTQFAADLTTAMYDRANEATALADELATLQTYYSAALMHRRENKWHLVNQEGELKPYTEEEIAKGERLEAKELQEYDEWLAKERDIHLKAYWGEGPLPELDEDQECCQLVIPVWVK